MQITLAKLWRKAVIGEVIHGEVIHDRDIGY